MSRYQPGYSLGRRKRHTNCFHGAYAAVLHALGGMDRDLPLLDKDDIVGRKLQDLKLPTRKRAEKSKK